MRSPLRFHEFNHPVVIPLEVLVRVPSRSERALPFVISRYIPVNREHEAEPTSKKQISIRANWILL